ncbi:MAG: helix-turn-helix transcriptional regulator [Spirochaetia bacterium]
MSGNSSMKKSERLIELQFLLFHSADGLIRTEIAKKLGISKATAGRDIAELSTECAITEDENGRLSLDTLSFLNNISLTPSEMEVFNLAVRLLSRKIRFAYPPAASALRKLSDALKKYAPRFAATIENSAELFDCTGTEYDRPLYKSHLEILTQALVKSLEVKLTRYSQSQNKEVIVRFQPFHIEPHVEGNSLQVIGMVPGEGVRMFKFERIRGIELTKVPFQGPQQFHPEEYFTDAWSIWKGDEEPQAVKLLFSGRVAGRVLATRWHPSEECKLQEKGTLIWTARISEPTEMLPWVRGWGSDVEVLEPSWLRERIAADAAKTAEIYAKNVKKRNSVSQDETGMG